VAALVRDPRLAATAAALLGAPRLRLYQDCTFVKRPGFGATNWHSDLRMAPLDTNAFVTAWIPLRPIQARDRVRVYARAPLVRVSGGAARGPLAGPRRRLRPAWVRRAEARACAGRRTSSPTSAEPGPQSGDVV
jgi:hypothetical protein